MQRGRVSNGDRGRSTEPPIRIYVLCISGAWKSGPEDKAEFFTKPPQCGFPDIGRVFEKLIPDVSFAEHYFLLTRATLLGAQMFNYFVCILLTNSYSIEDKTGQEIGAGLYSLISCCNHSCTPNAQVIFGDSENAREATLVLLRPCAQKRNFISHILRTWVARWSSVGVSLRSGALPVNARAVLPSYLWNKIFKALLI